ncbi:MAG: hypothetical protein ACREWJ_09345 [Rhodoferax sp.]
MSHMTSFTRSFLLRCAAALIVLGSLTACGGGSVDVAVVAPAQPVVTQLPLALTRVGPEAVEVDWGDDPDVYSFDVLRDGTLLATVNTLSVIDNTVYFNETYCYQVQGYDASGLLVAATDTGCITIVP